MDGDNSPNEPGPSSHFTSGRHCMSEHMDDTPPSRQRDEDVDSEYTIHRSISCEQLAQWNSELFEKSYVKCPLPNCGIMFHGATQIQNHYISCTGRCEDAIIECNLCQALVTTEHIQQHMKAMHRLDQSPQPSSDSGSSEVARATGVMERDCRQSQQKSGVAVSVIGADDEERDLQRTEIYIENKEHQSFKFVNREVMERQWHHELNVSGCASCPVEGCHLSFPSMSGILQHFQHCLGKAQEAFVCELCSKRFVSGRMLNDHMIHVHGEDIMKIRIRNLDASMPEYNIRRRLVEEDDSERRRRSGNGQVYSPVSIEDEVSVKSCNERQWKQRDYRLLSHDPGSECYIPQTSPSVYNVSKNHAQQREVTGQSMHNAAVSVKSHHSIPKPQRILDYEKERISDSSRRCEAPSAFLRVKDKNGGEPRILKVYDIESDSSSRMSSFSEPGVLFSEKEDREPVSSDDPFFRPMRNQPLRTYVRKLGCRSPVYPSTSGIKRKYPDEHYANVYETVKNRKYRSTLACSAGYTSDESEDDGRPHAKYDRRLQHSPATYTHPRSLFKTDVYPTSGWPIRRDQSFSSNLMHNMQSPFVNYTKKESNVFERPLLPEESNYSGSKCSSISSLWEEEEDMFSAPVHIKKRELAERAQQLRRVEEAVKQQEEEAQERTWRALREQEIALREKEEALKQREAAAQKKFEEATRLMEETRKLGDLKKFKDKNLLSSSTNMLLSVEKRNSSASVSHGNTDTYLSTLPGPGEINRTDSSLELQEGFTDCISLENITYEKPEDNFNQQRLERCLSDNSLLSTKNSFSRDGNEFSKSLETHSSLRSVSPHNKTSGIEMCSTKNKTSYSRELNENIPSIEPSKVVRTYSRTQRRSTLISSGLPLRAQSLTPNNKLSCDNVGIDSKEVQGATVINGGATVTITPLIPSERPSRPYSAMPNMQPTGTTEYSEAAGLLRSRPTSALESRIDIPVSLTVTRDEEEMLGDSPLTFHTENVKLPTIEVKVMCEDEKMSELTSKRKESKETSVIHKKDDSISKKKGRNLSMISLAGVSIPGHIIPSPAWEIGSSCHENLMSAPSVQIVQGSPVQFDVLGEGIKKNDSSTKFETNLKASGQFSNVCLDLSVHKTRTLLNQQDVTHDIVAHKLLLDTEREVDEVPKQLEHDEIDLPQVNHSGTENAPLSLESPRSKSSCVGPQEQIYVEQEESSECYRDSVSSSYPPSPSRGASVSPPREEYTYDFTDKMSKNPPVLSKGVSSCKELSEEDCMKSSIKEMTSPIHSVSSLHQEETSQVETNLSVFEGQIAVETQESSGSQTAIKIDHETENQMPQEEKQICERQEQEIEQNFQEKDKWPADHLEQHDNEIIVEQSLQEVTNLVPEQEIFSNLEKTHIVVQGVSEELEKEHSDSVVPVEQGGQEEQASGESENKEVNNVNMNVSEGTSHIIGEFDPSTGTFISSNPALLKSILGNTVTYPLGSLPEETLTHELNNQIAPQLPVISHIKQVSVQSQTVGDLDVQLSHELPHGEGLKDSEYSSNVETYEHIEKRQSCSEGNVKENVETKDLCERYVTRSENMKPIHVSKKMKIEESSSETENQTVIDEQTTKSMQYELSTAVDDDVSSNEDHIEFDDTGSYNEGECPDVILNSNTNECLPSGANPDGYLANEARDTVLNPKINIELPEVESSEIDRSPDSTILFPPIYVSSGISESNLENKPENDVSKSNEVGEQSEIVRFSGAVDAPMVSAVEENTCDVVSVIGGPQAIDEIDNTLQICKSQSEMIDVENEENFDLHTQAEEATLSKIIMRGKKRPRRGTRRKTSYTRRFTRRKARGRGKVDTCELKGESEDKEADIQVNGNNSTLEELGNLSNTQNNSNEMMFTDMAPTVGTGKESTQNFSRTEEEFRQTTELISPQDTGKYKNDTVCQATSTPRKNYLCSIGSPDYVEDDICSDMCKTDEERIEHVSRGGRKLKLKEWWTGVVTDSLTPRSRTSSLSKSPRSSSAKSPIRSPPRIPTPRQYSSVKEEKRPSSCQEDEYQMNESFTSDYSLIGNVSLPDVSGQEQTTVADNSLDNSEVPENENESLKPKKRGQANKIDQQSLPSGEKVEIKCGKCGVVSNARSHFNYHIMIEHNGLARPDGEDQNFTDAEVKQILNKTMKAIKKLKCGVCSNMFRSLLGYKKHTELCGKSMEDLKTTCKICNKEMRHSSIAAHMRVIHLYKKGEPRKVEANKSDSVVSMTDRPRRRAAANCNERLKVWRSNRTGDSGSEDTDNEDDFKIELEPGKFYSKPILEDISKELRVQWESQLDTFSEGSCNNEGCTFKFSSIPQAKSHFYLCPHSITKRVFSCKNCEYTSQSEREMKSHVTSIHIDLTTGMEEESDFDISDDGSDIPFRQYRRLSHGQFKPFEPAMSWTTDFLKDSISENLFSQYFTVKDDWIELDYQLSLKYLSSIKCSPKVKVRQTGESSNHENDKWQTIEQLSSESVGGEDIIFCGGPIVSTAWCTLPLNVSLASCSQYLAISTMKFPEKEYSILKSIAHEGCIQIWEYTSVNGNEHLKFVFGIAHEYGNAWSLAWCPSGVYEHLKMEPTTDDKLKRLGLLAAAFSDGFIRIYVIPQPSELGELKGSKIFKLQPRVTLSPGMLSKGEAQCLRLDWFKGKGHADIAGAFSDGVVCVWDISSLSSLFYVKDQHGNCTVYPRNSFQAHNGVCSVVAFCNTTSGRNLLSGGNDRTYKYWDLHNTDMPLSITRKGLVLDAVWLLHWAGCFVSFDDVYGLSNTSTNFRECGFFGIQSRNVLSSNAPVWCLSGSEWLNAIVQGDAAGEVVLTIQQQLFQNYENDKFPSKRKVPLVAVRLEHLENASRVSFKSTQESKANASEKTKAKSKEKSKTSKKSKKSRNIKDKHEEIDFEDDGDGLCTATYIEWPQTYADACKNYGIVFNKQNTQDFSKISASEMDERRRSSSMEPGPVACYPLMATTAISWNNNAGAHTRIFVGTASGLCKVVNVSSLNTPEGQKFIRNLNR